MHNINYTYERNDIIERLNSLITVIKNQSPDTPSSMYCDCIAQALLNRKEDSAPQRFFDGLVNGCEIAIELLEG